MSEMVEREIEAAAKTMHLYERVHEDLDEGLPWESLDNGFVEAKKNVSYEAWNAYMSQRITNHLKSIILAHRAAALTPSRAPDGE